MCFDKTHLGLRHECLDREINKDGLCHGSAVVIHNIPISVVQCFTCAINNSSGDQEIYCCYDGIADSSLSRQTPPLDIGWYFTPGRKQKIFILDLVSSYEYISSGGTDTIGGFLGLPPRQISG
jgi:hypothetical protein